LVRCTIRAVRVAGCRVHLIHQLTEDDGHDREGDSRGDC
jgi:hypothetical protein